MTMKEKESAIALVAGGAGFLGKHLRARLAEEGIRAFSIDNFNTSRTDNKSTYVDICGNELFQWAKKFDFDYVFNLACPASPAYFHYLDFNILDACSNGVRNLLEVAEDNNAIFVQASSSEVYGKPSVHPQSESYWGNVNPIGARSAYDEGKRFAEALCKAKFNHYGTNIRIARIFNTYGEGMSLDGRVIPNFISSALSNKPIKIYGSGRKTRSFCYVGDLVDGLIKLANADMRKKGFENRVFNLGNTKETTLRALAEKVRKLAGSKSEIRVVTFEPEDDPPHRKPDIHKAIRKLGWKPTTNLDNGLEKTIAWFKTSEGRSLIPP